LERAASQFTNSMFSRSLLYGLLALFSNYILTTDGTTNLSELLRFFRYAFFDLFRDDIVSNARLAYFINDLIFIRICSQINAFFDADRPFGDS